MSSQQAGDQASAKVNQLANYRDEHPGVAESDDADLGGPGDASLDVESRSALVDRAQHGERLDKVLVAMAPEFSRSHLQALVGSGRVFVDGVVSDTASRRIKAGQQVRVDLVPTAESLAFRPEDVPLDVVFEDEHLLVLDKPAGLVVHPAAGNWSGTLLNGLLSRYPLSGTLPRAGIVHRLDKDTSGLMVVGKTLPAVTALVRAISQREVHREYLALAHGALEVKAQSVEQPIGRDPASRVRMAVVVAGRAARTDVERLTVADDVTAVRCTLHTGRTHQIRVHMAWLGHPLVGDTTYGGRPLLGMQRQALHARRLQLRHPLRNEELEFISALPRDLADAWFSVTHRRL